MPTQRELESGSAVLTRPGFAAATDARAAFRAVFCELLTDETALQSTPADCDDYLWRLTDEANHADRHTAPPALHPARQRPALSASPRRQC